MSIQVKRYLIGVLGMYGKRHKAREEKIKDMMIPMGL